MASHHDDDVMPEETQGYKLSQPKQSLAEYQQMASETMPSMPYLISGVDSPPFSPNSSYENLIPPPPPPSPVTAPDSKATSPSLSTCSSDEHLPPPPPPPSPDMSPMLPIEEGSNPQHQRHIFNQGPGFRMSSAARRASQGFMSLRATARNSAGAPEAPANDSGPHTSPPAGAPGLVPGSSPAPFAHSATAHASVLNSHMTTTDAGDESLQRYKESLGLSGGKDLSDPNDKRVCIIKSLTMEAPGRDPVTIDLSTPGSENTLKDKPFKIKEGAKFTMVATFKVQHEILSGLHYVQIVKRKGIRVSKDSEMIGSYAPNTDKQPLYTKKFQEEEAPSGMLARGHYNAISSFVDDDKKTHLAFEWSFDIGKEW